MAEDFYKQPISPYEYPSRHWVLDAKGQPTGEIMPERRPVRLATPGGSRHRCAWGMATNGGLSSVGAA